MPRFPRGGCGFPGSEWQTWTTVTKAGVNRTAGPHVLRIKMDTNGSTGYVGKFNWIRISIGAATAATATSAPTPIFANHVTDEEQELDLLT